MLLDKLQADLKQSQLDRDELKTSTLRLLLSEAHNNQIQKGARLEDQDIISLVQREIKKRHEAAEAYKNAGRVEQTKAEESEAKILEGYLPQQLSDDQLQNLVKATITELGATSMVDMGKVMAALMGKVGQSAEPARVSTLVKEELSK